MLSKSPSQAATRPNSEHMTTRPNHNMRPNPKLLRESNDVFDKIPQEGTEKYASLAQVKTAHATLVFGFLVQCFCAGSAAIAKPELLFVFLPLAALMLVGIFQTKKAMKNYASS